MQARASGWRYEQTLTASNGAAFDQFGISVGIDGDTIIVGAERADVNGQSSMGSAYVFTYANGSWDETQILTESLSALDYYGSAVAINGDTLAVGARFEASGGKAFVYDRGTNGMWNRVATLSDVIFDPNANFGVSLALDGDTLVVGADFHDTTSGSFDNRGAVYVFDRNTPTANAWGYVTHLTAPVGSSKLGHSVALHGNTLVSGARFSSTPDPNNPGEFLSSTGRAFVYENSSRSPDTWSEVAVLEAGADTAAYNYFGKSVAIRGDAVLVGANGFNNGRGKVYQFSRGTGWAESDTYTASDGVNEDGFGNALAAGDSEFAIGAPFGNALYIHPQEASPTAINMRQFTTDSQPNPALLWSFVGVFVSLTIMAGAIRKKSLSASKQHP